MTTVRKEALALSPKARLHLIEELWDSLSATPEVVPVTDAQRRELARRRGAHMRNPDAARPWSQVTTVRLTPEAELDLAEAHSWYSAQRRVLGRDFLRALDQCIAAIRRHPQAYQLVDRKMRRALLRRFPYGVFFEVLAGEIIVYGVFHGARDPRAWKRRTNA
jgi:putative addiction module component (TIGR02574 family)